jgi:hypothetical protein
MASGITPPTGSEFSDQEDVQYIGKPKIFSIEERRYINFKLIEKKHAKDELQRRFSPTKTGHIFRMAFHHFPQHREKLVVMS